MSDLKKTRKDQLRLEFIKSAAMLLLAVVLLISVAFAWFKSAPETTNVLDITLSVTSPEGEHIGLGTDVTVARSIVLPCATKFMDQDISSTDFSRAIVVEVYTLEPSVAAKVSVSVTPDSASSGLHYYVCSYTEGTDETSIAQALYDGAEYDKTTQLSIPTGESKIAVVYWAEYNEAFESAVTGTGKMVEYKAVVKFDAAKEE